MNPGATALTRMPWTISSLATDRVKPRMPGFRRGVMGVPGAALDPADRRHVHDRAAPAGRHRARGCPGPVERPVEVDGEDEPPLVVGEPHERVERRLRLSAGGDLLALALQRTSHAADVVKPDRARVVDEDLEWPELLLDLLDRAVDLSTVSDVDLDSESRSDRVDRPLGAREREVENGDRCPFAGEAMADRLTDSCPTAGDSGDLAVEPQSARLMRSNVHLN